MYLVKTPEQLGQALPISGAQGAQGHQQGSEEGAVLKGAAAVVVELQHLQLQAQRVLSHSAPVPTQHARFYMKSKAPCRRLQKWVKSRVTSAVPTPSSRFCCMCRPA